MMVKEFKEFNCFITLYSQTLGVVTVEYDERSLNKTKWKAVKNKFVFFFNLGLCRNLLCDVI